MEQPNAHVSIALTGDRNDVVLRGGSFYTQVGTFRLDYSFTPNLSWQNLQPYDTESSLLSFQSRFRWILKPGNDLFLVINRGWVRDLDGGYQLTFDRSSSKLQYTFRF